jgi:hypothetical protein
MKRPLSALGSCLALSLAVVACQDTATAPTLAPATRVASVSELKAQSSLGLAARVTVLPSLTAEVADLDRASVDDAINPNSYVCSAASPINSYVNDQITNSLTKEHDRIVELVNDWDVANVPYYEAVYLKSASTPQTYGYDGEFTKIIVKTERDVKNFWDLPSDDIQVVSMRDDVLFDVERLAATYNYVYGVPYPTATEYAEYVRNLLVTSQTMNGHYAYWTFNAVSLTTTKPFVQRKIVMGDGILEGYKALGFDDVAPQAIFAHEFAHQIQFAKGYRTPTNPVATSAAERSRYTELMADAFSAYYLTHSRGAAMNQKRVEQFLEVFFQIGDCSFASSGHHGTPNQRMAAARFGFSVADEAQKQGHILTGAEFFARFAAQYPTIIAPDAPKL